MWKESLPLKSQIPPLLLVQDFPNLCSDEHSQYALIKMVRLQISLGDAGFWLWFGLFYSCRTSQTFEWHIIHYEFPMGKTGCCFSHTLLGNSLKWCIHQITLLKPQHFSSHKLNNLSLLKVHNINWCTTSFHNNTCLILQFKKYFRFPTHSKLTSWDFLI